MKKVVVASHNPVKINSVRIGFEKMFPCGSFEFESVSVESDVKDQPKSYRETLKGAVNRASNAFKKMPRADYWVGIEGGIEEKGNEMEAFAWVVIKSKNKVGKAKTGTFFLPNKIIKLIKEGKELGEADDIVFGRRNSKQENGAVGILTDNVIDRTKYYSEAVILAMIPFKNPDLY